VSTIEQEISRLIQKESKILASSKREIERARLKIKNDPYSFRYLSDALKNNLELARYAVEEDPTNFKHAPDELKKDLKLSEQAVKKDSSNFGHAPYELRNNLELATWAVKDAPYNFHSASEELRGNLEFATWAVEISPGNFKYVPDKLKNNLEFSTWAVEISPSNFEHVPYELRNNLELAKFAVREDSFSFQHASKELRGNSEFARYAVEIKPTDFSYVSEELRHNTEFAKWAVEKNYSNFKYVSEELKNDLEFATDMVEKNPTNFQYVSDDLKNNFDLAKFAVGEDSANITNVSDELKNKLPDSPFHDPHKSPEQVEISKNTPASLYDLVRYLKKNNLEFTDWVILEKLDLTEDKHTNNLIREYNQTHVSPLVKKFVQNLDKNLSKKEQQQKIKEYRGKLNSEFKIPVEFIVESRSFHSEKIVPENLKQPKDGLSEIEKRFKDTKTLDISDPEISEAIKEFRNIILNKGVTKHHTWSGDQKIFPSTNHVMMLVIPKDIIPPRLYELNKIRVDHAISKSEHPFIKGNLTIGWVRYTLGKDITGNKDNEDVWIDEIQTDFSSVFGKENMKQVFPIEKISYLLVKKSIKFRRAKGFEKIYIPTFELSSHLYDREESYVPPYTSIPQKLRFKRTELNDFHKKVDGNQVWVLAKKKLDSGYTFDWS